MKIGYQYYQITGKDLLKLFEDSAKRYRAQNRHWKKFATEVGADTRYFLVHSASDNRRAMGFMFKDNPDERLWRRVKSERAWVPRRDTKEGRELYKKFDALPKWDTEDLQKAVGFKLMWSTGYVHFFSPFFTKDFYGFRVPIFDEEEYKAHPQNKYVPVKGIKEISLKTYQRKINGL